MAASGPKAIEVAGEVADGVLLLVGFNRGIVQRALEHLERGARRGGRRLDDLEIIWLSRMPTPSKPPASAARMNRMSSGIGSVPGMRRWTRTGLAMARHSKLSGRRTPR